jgi:hypothetical protein
MNQLRLGPVADDKPVKLTIELPGTLMRELKTYGEVHARLNEQSDPLPPERLIPPMIERFISSDRGFARARRQR